MRTANRSVLAGAICLLAVYSITLASRQGADQRVTQYFVAECSVDSPRDEHVGDMVLLTCRQSDPANSRITEQIISISSGPEPIAEHSLVWTVSGNKANIAETGGAKSNGTATLNGDAWKWSAFDYELKMGDGSGTIRKHAEMSGDGMVVETKFIGSDGNPRVTISERHRGISKETFDLLRARLLPGAGMSPTTQPAGSR